MRRRPTNLGGAFQRRVEAIEALRQALADPVHRQLAAPAEALAELGAKLDGPTGPAYRGFAQLMQVLELMLEWVDAVRQAESEADRFLRAAKLRLTEMGEQGVPPPLGDVAVSLAAVSDVTEVAPLLEELLSITLPLPLFAATYTSRPSKKAEGDDVPPPPPPVAVIAFTIDGEPLADSTIVLPNVAHDLGVSVRLSEWPPWATSMTLSPLTVEEPEVFKLPSFDFEVATLENPTDFSGTGRMLLAVPQSIRSRPLQFAYQARFRPTSPSERVLLEGQRRFEIRSHDARSQPTTGYVEVDVRLLELNNQLRSFPGVSDKDREDFLTLYAAVGAIAGRSLQDNLFKKGRWTEDKWQDWLIAQLRARPEIGSALEVHPEAAGGITDLSFHRVRLELKAEPDHFVSQEDARGFVPQTAQYVVGSDKRLGVLAILASSPKTDAPGNVGNDLFLEALSDPGGGPIPTLVGVAIVRGNLARPSDLSR